MIKVSFIIFDAILSGVYSVKFLLGIGLGFVSLVSCICSAGNYKNKELLI